MRFLTGTCLVLLGLLGLAACGHRTDMEEEARVRQTFESCKSALLNHQTDRVLAYLPADVFHYFLQLNSGTLPPGNELPGVTLLLRTALDKKVPADLRKGLTLDVLLQRISDRRLLNLHDVDEINIGRVSVNGSRAAAEINYQGTLTALRLPFIKEGPDWKIDLMAVLPSAELLMRLDRAIKGETESQQVDALVSRLPSL